MTPARKYITRANSGWLVRIKNVYSKWFSDKNFGGKKDSLYAAQEYRDEKCGILNIPLIDGRVTGPRESSARSVTGIIGVNYYDGKWKGLYWNKPNHRYHNKQYSIDKYGECEAFQKACRYRYEKCGELKVYRGFDFPCEIPVPFEYIN